MREVDMSVLFVEFRYVKPAREVADACWRKAEMLELKIAERGGRIREVREKHGIDDRALVQLLQTYIAVGRMARTLGYSNATKGGDSDEIEAGIVAQFQAEQAAIESERSQVERLRRIARNIVDTTHQQGDPVTLRYDDLAYLGF